MAPVKHGEHDLGANRRSARPPPGEKHRRSFGLGKAADGIHRGALHLLRLFRFQQAVECRAHSIERVEGQQVNRRAARGGRRWRIGGGVRGLRKELIDRVPRLRVPVSATKAFAGTFQAVADSQDDVFQRGEV